MDVIETHGLRKVYRHWKGRENVALDGLDLVVEGGGVFGFLGPNGSGKTTTIRCLLGLSRPTEGTCRILGKDPTEGLADVIARIGSLVEAPASFPHFTGRRNLELLAAIDGIEEQRIDLVLEAVDLRERANEPVRAYSLGMKQRLGIAAALLKDPDLLILDEPANGLDPAGIREVRHLLRRLGAEGKTILLSSHLLTEVQQTCDRVAILARGRLVTQGAVSEVLSSGRGGDLLLRISEPSRAARTLARAGYAITLSEGAVCIDAAAERGAEVARLLAQHDLYPDELKVQGVDLETVFLQLTGEEEVAA